MAKPKQLPLATLEWREPGKRPTLLLDGVVIPYDSIEVEYDIPFGVFVLSGLESNTMRLKIEVVVQTDNDWPYRINDKSKELT